MAFWNLKIKTFHMQKNAIFCIDIVKLSKDGHGITLTGCSEKQRTDACMSGMEDLHCIKMYSFVSPYCLGWYDTVANTLGRLSWNCHTVDKL